MNWETCIPIKGNSNTFHTVDVTRRQLKKGHIY